MNEKQNKINIYELAKATGFSSSTVSKAINNTGRISEKTRKLILEKAHELNYVASYHAKALSQKRSYIIAIIYSDNLGHGLSHPHFSVILDNFKREVENKGYEVTFVNRNMGNTEMTYLEFCQYRNVDGVFIVNYYNLSKQIPELIESGIPIVATDGGNLNITTVISNDLQGGKKATEYLIKLGHTRIDHIAGPFYTESGRLRHQGFIETMEKHNLSDYLVHETFNYGFDDGYNKAIEIIETGNIPTALFVASDWMALGVIKAFHQHGIKIPEDVSIIGYDNLDFLEFTTPSLTTISQNKPIIGQTAANYLIEMINGTEKDSINLDVTVVERETCKKI